MQLVINTFGADLHPEPPVPLIAEIVPVADIVAAADGKLEQPPENPTARVERTVYPDPGFVIV